ncbi:hypothetical protein [Haloprofundus sp. MHR1]|uniref:hypothetical protein n=1 Tax=Haloprofundus sp. MHR1 TaxID=2572921 RepID=UPI0010BE732A|nr:hypothetical protein [Haloprofundus sp. MHR1]QCJ47226.1 hypothetical protein FCF25_08900 [Haloprofundus sp. MHR1]
MSDSEVHSLILDRVDEIEDEDLRAFLRDILRHERDILKEPRAEYADRYRGFVDGFVGNESLRDYNDE